MATPFMNAAVAEARKEVLSLDAEYSAAERGLKAAKAAWMSASDRVAMLLRELSAAKQGATYRGYELRSLIQIEVALSSAQEELAKASAALKVAKDKFSAVEKAHSAAYTTWQQMKNSA